MIWRVPLEWLPLPEISGQQRKPRFRLFSRSIMVLGQPLRRSH